MDGDKLKIIIDGLGEGVWKDNGWPTDFDAILRIYEEESRKIRH